MGGAGRTITASGIYYYFPSGFYQLSNTLTIQGNAISFVGDSLLTSTIGSVIVWAGAGTGGAAVFDFNNSGTGTAVQFVTVAGLNFKCTADTTNQKTFIRLVDVRTAWIDKIQSLNSQWTGASSVGVEVDGREFIHITNSQIGADIPLQIGVNPNVAAESFDHSNVTNTCLTAATTTTGTAINVLTSATLTNAKFENTALVLGARGFSFIDTTGTHPSYNVAIDNCRWEQNAGGAAQAIDIEGNTTTLLIGLTIKDFYLSGTAGTTKGVKIRNTYAIVLDNLDLACAGPTGTAVDVDNSCQNLNIVGGFTNFSGTYGSTLRVQSMGAGSSFAIMPVPAVRAFNSSAQSLATSTTTALVFDSTRYDSFPTQHSNAANKSRLTCTVAGLYRITGQVRFAASTSGDRQLGIRLNGATFLAFTSTPSTLTASVWANTITTEYRLSIGDYVELTAMQNSGLALNVDSAGNYSPEFMWVKVAD